MKIGDMILLKEVEKRHNKRYFLVKCSICGKERIVQLNGLKRVGNKHNISVCREKYVEHEYLGKMFGDYECVGVGNLNKILLRCRVCGKELSVVESQLKDRKHSYSVCGEAYYDSMIGTVVGGFEVLGNIKLKNNTRKIISKCLKCGTVRETFIQYFNEENLTHRNCITHLPDDEIKKSLMGRWHNINERTQNPNNTHYDSYGGRGIKNEFEDFIEFYYHFYDDLKNNPELTIDRIDVNGNYSKENTRLISHFDQQSNKRETYYFIAKKGDKKVISNNSMEFGRIYGVNGRSVGNCLRGASKSAGGWTFQKISKEEFIKITSSVTTKTTTIVEEI